MPELRKPPAAPRPNLTERIAELAADIESYINAHAEAEAKANPGVPAVAIYHNLMSKVSWCKCAAVEYLEKTR
jgi:hypothetical protein